MAPGLNHPAFATLAPWLACLPEGRFPGCDDLNRMFGDDLPLRCIPPDGLDEIYELRISRRGELLTRPDNWHDLFNALAWRAFPQTKRALNELHVAHFGNSGNRGTARDVLTLLDEDGLLVACGSAQFKRMLIDFQWKTLFWDHRRNLHAQMDFHVLGHALYDKMRAPFLGVTAKAMLLEVDETYFALPAAQRRPVLDGMAAARVREPSFVDSTRSLTPLPVLGIPGWCPDNEHPAYYEDTRQFRLGRKIAP